MSASSDKLKALSLIDLFYSILLNIVVHYVFILLIYILCMCTRSPLPVTKSLVLSCSMKTLPIAMTSTRTLSFFTIVISFLPEELGSHGIILVPALLFHFTQVYAEERSHVVIKYIVYDRAVDSKG